LSVAGVFFTDCENRARSPNCSVMRSWAWPAGGCLQQWSPSFAGKDSTLSMFSISPMVVACFPHLSVNASRVAPARGLAHFAARQTWSPLMFSNYSFVMWLLDWRIDLCSSAFACAAASDLLPILFSLHNALLLSLSHRSTTSSTGRIFLFSSPWHPGPCSGFPDTSLPPALPRHLCTPHLGELSVTPAHSTASLLLSHPVLT